MLSGGRATSAYDQFTVCKAKFKASPDFFIQNHVNIKNPTKNTYLQSLLLHDALGNTIELDNHQGCNSKVKR
jgi:hypothetical protein